MLMEVLEGLAIKPEGIYVDCTFGRGGHTTAILNKLTIGKVIAFDQDLAAIEAGKSLQASYPEKLNLIHANFKHLRSELDRLDIHEVDGILMDLGVSSPQFDDPTRGFSYRYDSRLDMRMDQSQKLDAYNVVNTYTFEQLVQIFRRYGEEPYAKQIARKIEASRMIQPIETTLQLVNVIKSALPSKVLSQKGHPAKQVFQALRIEVNAELEVLENVLDDAIELLKPDGRLAVLTFHSLEDRMVKQAFQKRIKSDIPSKLPLVDLPESKFSLISHKAITSGESELESNTRAHSAKLRILRKN